MLTDTIVALASGWGVSAQALIRISGPSVRAIERELFEQQPQREPALDGLPVAMTSATAHRRVFRLREAGAGLPCDLVRWTGPRSFTGEDTLEMVIPGGPALIERVLARLTAWSGAGVIREAGPGEFSARALLAGKLSMQQAEGIAATIAAGSERDLVAARRLLDGSLGDIHRAWADACAVTLALVEAGIDFTDQEDVVPIAPAELARRLDDLSSAIDAALSAAGGREHERGTPRVVLVGPPNAGKSTLFNRLLGCMRSVESEVAGATRDAIVEPLSLGPRGADASDAAALLIDLAGLDEALGNRGIIDAQAQAIAHEEISRASVIVLCTPANAGPGSAQRTLHTIRSGHARVLRVRTKADLGWGAGDSEPAIGVCALDGWNLGALRRAIADAILADRGQGPLGASENDSGLAAMIPRHRRMLSMALRHLHVARRAISPDAAAIENLHALPSPELVAAELRLALDALGELIGRMSPDDIIGRVFATFCIGK
jgi:tRNA modification GTPase